MGRMLQVRNLDDDVHAELVRRAEAEGKSLSDFVKNILEIEVQRMSWVEIRRRLDGRPTALGGKSAADLVREGREDRDRELDERLRHIWEPGA